MCYLQTTTPRISIFFHTAFVEQMVARSFCFDKLHLISVSPMARHPRATCFCILDASKCDMIKKGPGPRPCACTCRCAMTQRPGRRVTGAVQKLVRVLRRRAPFRTYCALVPAEAASGEARPQPSSHCPLPSAAAVCCQSSGHPEGFHVSPTGTTCMIINIILLLPCC